MAVATAIEVPLSPTQSRPTSLKYRPDIDGLRAVAVLAVVGFHAFPGLFVGGFIGVDIFFVISGYLISGIIFADLENQNFSFARFYARRIKRIFPALILVLAATYAFGWFVLLADEYQRLNMHIAGGSAFAANFTLWNEIDYFNAPQRNPLTHLWSLGVEEQYYLVWPMLAWLLWKRRSSFLAAVLLLGFSSFVLNVGAFGGPTAAFYLPGSRLWELLVGCILAYLSLHPPSWWRLSITRPAEEAQRKRQGYVLSNLAATIGLLLIAAGMVLIDKNKEFPGWWALFPTIGAYLVVSAGPDAWFNRRILANRALVCVGLISYPLYLWHWPLLSFAAIWNGRMPMLNIRVMIVLLSLALATLTYLGIEKPIRSGRHVRAKVATLCLLMMVVGCTGFTTYKLHGLEFRSTNLLYGTNLAQLKWFHPDSTCLRLVGIEAEYQDKQAVFCSLWDAPDTVRVAILGDSTANALYPGFEKVLKRERQIGVINLGNGTCAPFRGLEGVFDWNRDCKEINDKIYGFLLRNPQIKMVVLGLAAWDIKNMRFGGLAANASLEARFAAVSKLIERDVSALEQAGKKVVITYDSPLFSIDPRKCVPRGVYWRTVPECTFTEEQLVDREPYLSLWQTTMAKHQDVCTFQQSARLKVDGRFSILSPDGTLLYRDDEHLSYSGSERVAQEFVNSQCAHDLRTGQSAVPVQPKPTGGPATFRIASP